MDVTSILKDIGNIPYSEESKSHDCRLRLLALFRASIVALETPSEVIQRIGWAAVSFSKMIYDIHYPYPPSLPIQLQSALR